MTFTNSSATSGPYTDDVAIEAALASSDGAVEGATVTFELDGVEKPATTDEAGIASASFVLISPPAPYTVRASFAGRHDALPAQATDDFDVLEERTALSLDVRGHGSKRMLVATLLDDDAHPVVGRTVDFYADGIKISDGKSVTDSSGVAVFDPPGRYQGGRHEYVAAFEGDIYYIESSSRGPANAI